MTGMDGNDLNVQRAGEEWIRAVVQKDFSRLAEICQPDVRSRLMTPKRFDSFENSSDLVQKVDDWFSDCYSIEKDQSRIEMVGEKLAIFYRLSFVKNGQSHIAEQQLYCTLRDGLIDQLNLLCSGFQPIQSPVDTPIGLAMSAVPSPQRSTGRSFIQADAFLRIDLDGGKESTCSILTPSIKHKLGEMNSGQVLEIHVDDTSAKEDIEAWCRLSGNTLLKMEQDASQELLFYLMKK